MKLYFRELVELKSHSMSVPYLRKLLGLGKTDSYWLIHQGKFESLQINGKYYINTESFEKWYANQIKYKKVNGPQPGSELTAVSYSVPDLAAMLGVADDTIYTRVKNGEFEIFLVDGWIRITKESFDRWYEHQERLRTDADKQKDSDAEQSSISLTDAAHLLGTHRNNLYSLIQNHPERFDIIIIAGRKRITLDSFERWYQGQSRYKKVITDEPPAACEACSETIQENSSEPESPVAISTEEVQTAEKPYYTVEEVQALLSLTKRDAYNLVQSDSFKVIRVGKRYLIPKDSFETWLHINQAQKEEI